MTQDRPRTTDPTHPFGPDAIWAPWRLPYLESLGDAERHPPTAGSPPRQAEEPTFLSFYWSRPDLDAAHHVIHRTADGMILLNKYPYANGHLLVALGEPRPTLLDYTPDQRGALWRLVDLAADLMHRTLEPQGINIGINQGRAAGAAVPAHLHAHLVPRWSGDTNFMGVVGQVRVIPASLEAMHGRYRTALVGGDA
jgi:ATP adenylyltransferase